MIDRKMRWILPAMVISLTVMTACGNAAESDDKSNCKIPSISFTSETAAENNVIASAADGVMSSADNSTIVLADNSMPASMTEEKTVSPLEEKYESGITKDYDMAASFEPAYISENEDGTLSMRVKIYDYEKFSADDVDGLKTGDRIVIRGKAVRVETLSGQSAKSVYINGDIDDYGYVLLKEGDIYRELNSSDDYKYLNCRDTLTLNTSKDFVYIDRSQDPNGDGIRYDNEGFAKAARENDAQFGEDSTVITVRNGIITGITKTYVP